MYQKVKCIGELFSTVFLSTDEGNYGDLKGHIYIIVPKASKRLALPYTHMNTPLPFHGADK